MLLYLLRVLPSSLSLSDVFQLSVFHCSLHLSKLNTYPSLSPIRLPRKVVHHQPRSTALCIVSLSDFEYCFPSFFRTSLSPSTLVLSLFISYISLHACIYMNVSFRIDTDIIHSFIVRKASLIMSATSCASVSLDLSPKYSLPSTLPSFALSFVGFICSFDLLDPKCFGPLVPCFCSSMMSVLHFFML